MHVEVTEAKRVDLQEYASIPIAYRVVETVTLTSLSGRARSRSMTFQPAATSSVKDYDALPGNSPLDWPKRFDISHWGFLSARVGGQRVGGAALTFRDPTIDLLKNKDHLAILWDLRIAPAFRRRGVGSALVAAAESWARAKGARELMVETQNTNAAACRLYSGQGFSLRTINRGAYPALPDEVQLLWHKRLVVSDTSIPEKK